MARSRRGFTLVEILVSITILTILVLILSQVVGSAASIATMGNKRMDSDSQTRPILDRIGVDFSQIIKRTDVDYLLKSSSDNAEAGNDYLSFFCNAAGYYPSSSYQSPISLVSYRVNSDSNSTSFNRMERMGKGLIWNSVSSTNTPMLFGAGVIATNWPGAASSSTVDSDYELVAPQVFRFEYFYLLKAGVISSVPGAAGMQDISAIAVTLATIDQRSRLLFTNAQMTTLIGRLKDFDSSQPISDLTSSWQASLDATADMPRAGINGVRIYQRYFYLNPVR